MRPSQEDRDGSMKRVAVVARLEKTLGIEDLARFTRT
jgi:hypothetical protein